MAEFIFFREQRNEYINILRLIEVQKYKASAGSPLPTSRLVFILVIKVLQ